MRRQRKIVGLLFLIALLPAFGPAYGRNCRPNPDSCGDTNPETSLPVKIYRNFLVVAEGQLGGVPEPQNFILDTGTAPSIIDAEVARRLELPTESSMSRAVGKTLPTQATIIPEIRLGPIRITSLPLQVQDLSRLTQGLGIPIAGIVGLDVLSKSSFRLDYEKREIEFGPASNEGIPVRFDAGTNLAVAQVGLGGRTLRMLVDTGSNSLMLMGGNFADTGWLGLRNTSESASSAAEQGVGVRQFSAPDIALGERHFSQDKAYLVPDRADQAFDGFLGVRALGFRALSYDQSSGTIYLQK